jgi:hypothetical protein
MSGLRWIVVTALVRLTEYGAVGDTFTSSTLCYHWKQYRRRSQGFKSTVLLKTLAHMLETSGMLSGVCFHFIGHVSVMRAKKDALP